MLTLTPNIVYNIDNKPRGNSGKSKVAFRYGIYYKGDITMTVSKTMQTVIDTLKERTALWDDLNVSVSQILDDGREYMIIWIKDDNSERKELTSL